MKHTDFLCPAGRGFSRRNLLHGASVGIGASMLGWLFPARSRAEQGLQHYPTLGISKPSLASMPIAWSNDEYHRRWNLIRQRMKEARLDCLILPQHLTHAVTLLEYRTDADVLYLSGLPAMWLVFPIEGKITAIVVEWQPLKEGKPVPAIIMTRLFADNSPDIEMRSAPMGAPSPSIIDVLREMKMEHARIGVGSLTSPFQMGEGSCSYTTYDRVRKAFPQAQFEDAEDMLWRVKMVRSAEEIAVFENTTAVSEAGLLAMFETARPGVPILDVWLSMYGAMLKCSGSRPVHLSISALGQALDSIGTPLPDILESGQILSQECMGSVLGYGAEVNHSVLIGSEGPADWPAAARFAIDLFHTSLDQLAPGKNIKEFVDFYGQRIAARGPTHGGAMVHFEGYGDLPKWAVMTHYQGKAYQGPGDAVFQPGMVFDLKLNVGVKGTRMTAYFGDPIVITETGARRLGRRKMEIINLA
jgi:ectoine hydrolase